MILYSIAKTTPLFWELCALKEDIEACNSQSLELAKEIVTHFDRAPSKSQKVFHIKPPYFLAGGIRAVYFRSLFPVGWKELQEYSKLYYPVIDNISNKEIIESIGALQKVNYSELKDVLKFDCQIRENPLVAWCDKMILVAVNAASDYVPLEDMVRIDNSNHRKHIIAVGECIRKNFGTQYEL